MNNRFWMIGILVIMAVICAAALGLVNSVTGPVIALQNELAYKRTVLEVFGIPFPPEDTDAILAAYDEHVAEREVEGLTVFTEPSSGREAISIEGSGFQGEIGLIVSLDGTVITGFRVVSQVETPGLGARITEEPFERSFIGKDVENGIAMTRSGGAGPSEFDAITGATETSRALARILNRGFERYFAAAGE